MSRKPLTFEDLAVWQKACDLAVAVYEATKGYPRDERWGLVDQMRRAAVSVPSNIAEGSERWGQGKFAHSLSIALGSLAELRTQITLSRRFGYLSDEQTQLLTGLAVHTHAMASNLRKSLTARRNNQATIPPPATGRRPLSDEPSASDP